MANSLQIFILLTLQVALSAFTLGASLVRESDKYQANVKPSISELSLWNPEILRAGAVVEPPRPMHVVSGDDVFEGDILGINLKGLSQEQIVKRLSKNGIIGENYRWPGVGEMPYYIDTAFSAQERAVILKAILEINQKTNVFIRPYVTTDKDYLYVRKGEVGAGCNSYVGRQPGGQYLTLESVCLPEVGGKGTTIHELMHALGFHHEQARTDRDDYITIYKSNIIPSKYEVNFKTHVSNIYNQSYDFSSIMHYRKNAFAISSNLISIYPKVPYSHCYIGQVTGLSAIDIAKINSMYPGSGGMPARLPVGCDFLWHYNLRIRLLSFSNPSSSVSNETESNALQFYVTYYWESKTKSDAYRISGNTTDITFNDTHGYNISSTSTGSPVWVSMVAYSVNSTLYEELIESFMIGPYVVGPGTVILSNALGNSSSTQVFVQFESY